MISWYNIIGKTWNNGVYGSLVAPCCSNHPQPTGWVQWNTIKSPFDQQKMDHLWTNQRLTMLWYAMPLCHRVAWLDLREATHIFGDLCVPSLGDGWKPWGNGGMGQKAAGRPHKFKKQLDFSSKNVIDVIYFINANWDFLLRDSFKVIYTWPSPPGPGQGTLYKFPSGHAALGG